jgi:tetratricopeptide (TPR) repeat protein
VDESLVEQIVGGSAREAREAREAGGAGDASGAGDADEARYRLLETIREYALERLAEAGEATALRERHAGYYLDLAEAAEPALDGPGQVAWLDRLEVEHANLGEALRWWEAWGAAEEGLRLGAALRSFWHLRGHQSEGRDWLTAFLALPAPAVFGGVRAKALRTASNLAYLQGDHPTARRLAQGSLALSREVGDQRGCARAIFVLTLVAQRERDPAARALAEEAVAYARAAGDSHTLAHSLWILGIAVARSDPDGARAALEESLALFRALGDPWQCSVALNALAGLAHGAGARAEARRRYQEALALRRGVGDRRGIAIVLHNLGVLAAQEGDATRATERFREGLVLFRDVGDRHGVAWCLAGLAGASAADQPARAATILGAVTPHLSPGATALHPPAPAGRERTLAAVRRALGGAAFAAAWAAGEAMSLEQATDFALAPEAPGSVPWTVEPLPGGAPAAPPEGDPGGTP